MEKKTTTIGDTKSGKSTIGWKEVTIGGITGIVLGGATAYAAANVGHNDEVPEGNPDEPTDGNTTADDTTVEVLNLDDLSFDQAFAQAREQQGAGGSFEWHGQVYGTYYATEWNAMTPAQQQAFSQEVLPQHNIADTPSTPAEDPVQPAPATPTEDPVQPAPATPSDPDDNSEIEIIGFQQEANEDGSVANYGYMSVGGQNAVLVDIDGTDDTFDYMVVDLNNNQQIDEDEIIDISDQQLSVSDFQATAESVGAPVVVPENGPEYIEHPVEEYTTHYTDPNENYIANTNDLPDYMNDVDPVDLA